MHPAVHRIVSLANEPTRVGNGRKTSRCDRGRGASRHRGSLRGRGTKWRERELSDGELFYIIKNGVRMTGMPAWGGEGDDADNWKLVHFIRHLPKITPGEIEEMKEMNPISPHESEEKKKDEDFLKGH